MANKQNIVAYFQELNVTVSEAVLNKCLELCVAYNMDAEDFCDQWYAFTASNLNGALPTIDSLEKMERKEFHKNKDQNFSKLNAPKQNDEIQEERRRNLTESAVLSPQPKNVEEVEIPSTRQDESSGINGTPLSIKSSEKFSQRKDSKSVQNYYGSTTTRFKRESDGVLAIKVNENHTVPADVTYMYEIMRNKARSMNNMMHNLGHAILKQHKLNLSEGALFTKMGDTVTYGRIVSDADGRINSQSILLEGTVETNLNYTTRLNINKLSSYSLFPGQVIVAEGNNVKKTAFVAETIYTAAPLDLPQEPPIQTRTMQLVVAAGPFTLRDNLSYEPLKDLIDYVIENKPDVLILMGPFLEKTHDGILDGRLTQTVDDFFEELIGDIVMNSLANQDIHVVVVSSQKDAHHHPVYPTPPYRIREKYNKLTFVSDPSVIDIEGLTIAATTADILFHMSNYELHYDKESIIKAGRMDRIISHLLNQRSFYPLCPPHKDVSIDHVLLEKFGILEEKPHILILPSNLKNFVKDVTGCLVINPERLTKGFEAGTFARIEIEAGSSRSICNRTAVQILRI